MSAIHHHLHIPDLFNDVYHVEIAFNSLLELIIEPVSLWDILAAAAATVAEKNSPEFNAEMVEAHAITHANDLMVLDLFLEIWAQINLR